MPGGLRKWVYFSARRVGGIIMRQVRWLMVLALTLLVAIGFASSMAAQSINARQPVTENPASYWADPANWLEQFVPDSQLFWDNSKNWTTKYGPAYRDTVETPSEMLACSPQYALCFHSGPDPYPCHLAPDGRSANCLCTVGSDTNYTLMTAILNYPVYLATVKKCGTDGSACKDTDSAPVCKFLNGGALIPGADVMSTFDSESRSEILKALQTPGAPVTACPKGPYAACMTAPCRLNGDGTANCKCPVFYGEYQLSGKNATCSLGGDLVPSSSYWPWFK